MGDYNKTIRACFTGYIVQAIIINFAPLLFITFQTSYGISLPKTAMLISVNFGLQLLVDLLSAGLVDKIGYRTAAVAAHILAAAGLICLAVLPDVFPDPFLGLLTAIIIYAVGSGLIEVLVSPIVQACPSENKEKAMSMLHSFYCWGHVGVVLISTIYFRLIGVANWKYLAMVWAVIPIANAIMFTKVPIAPLIAEDAKGLSVRELFRNRAFWIMALLMVCAGACEQAASQWASAFTEQVLGVNKTIGDLAGPMLFAVMMGISRLIYGKHGEKLDLGRFMMGSAIVCLCSYIIIFLSPWPWLGLFGFGLCGLSVGILWPGTFSAGAEQIPLGGTAMFAFFALAGDLGCASGPALVGYVAGVSGDNLKAGLQAAVVLPIILIGGLMLKRTLRRP